MTFIFHNHILVQILVLFSEVMIILMEQCQEQKLEQDYMETIQTGLKQLQAEVRIVFSQ